MLVGIVSSLSLLTSPFGAPPPAPAPETPAVNMSTQATICNTYCDARDPALSPGDRAPVSATLSSAGPSRCTSTTRTRWAGPRSTTAVPATRCGWTGPSTAAAPGARGSRLGDTAIPAGQRGWRTLMYNVDDWDNHGVGALRACGKAGDRADIACTPWARTTWNAGDRRTAAATAQMSSTTTLDRAVRHHRLVELGQRADRRHRQHPGHAAWAATSTRSPGPTTATSAPQGGQFRNDYLDDTGWWGLAWVGRVRRDR